MLMFILPMPVERRRPHITHDAAMPMSVMLLMLLKMLRYADYAISFAFATAID